jgi:signal transduction histidine kinase
MKIIHKKTYRSPGQIKSSLLETLAKTEQEQRKLYDAVMADIVEFEDSQRLCTFLNIRCQERGKKLAQISQDKTRFVMEVSHELKAPLASIGSLLAVIVDGYVEDPAKSRELVERAYKRVGELSILVKDMLDLTRFELFSETLETEVESFGPLLKEVVELFENKAAAENIALTVEYPPTEIKVDINRTAIKRVLENLVSNAIKYNKPNGYVKISTESVAEMLKITVEDNGIGLTDIDKERLFEIFYRGTGAKSSSHEGTGLGLSLAKRLVIAHKGNLWVESVAGEGSRFNFTIPLG